MEKQTGHGDCQQVQLDLCEDGVRRSDTRLPATDLVLDRAVTLGFSHIDEQAQTGLVIGRAADYLPFSPAEAHQAASNRFTLFTITG